MNTAKHLDLQKEVRARAAAIPTVADVPKAFGDARKAATVATRTATTTARKA